MTTPLSGAIFCIGAQKAGTSWLYRYLSPFPQLHVHRNKELHFFNGLYPTRDQPDADFSPAGALAQVEEKIARLTALAAEGKARPWQKLRLAAHRDIRDHLLTGRPFLDIVSQDRPLEATHLRDITPKYSLLPAEAFDQMARAAGEVKFVFVMRDPVDRTWSHIRFQAQVAGTTPDCIWPRLQADPSGTYALQYWARSRYDQTLQALRAADGAQVLTLFYETLFTPATIRQLTDFLGLPFREPNLGKVVFASRPQAMPPAFEALARETLAPCYDRIRDAFGDRVPSSWRQ